VTGLEKEDQDLTLHTLSVKFVHKKGGVLVAKTYLTCQPLLPYLCDSTVNAKNLEGLCGTSINALAIRS